uniref:Immunoglobulin like and fibronectin type III domain containing 1 n=1 Tax=Anolis carolinensis TaxID=28377 RepID=A0A803TRR4_ANOCA
MICIVISVLVNTFFLVIFSSSSSSFCFSVKTKKSAIPGVTIAQFVEDVPKGCTTPDFERKPITLTLSEGKNAIFRAVVKGEPKPEVLWKRSTGKIDDPDRYQTTFIPGTNEFTLQINKITQDDADVYRFTAVNDYGEAACSAGLKIIQGKFHQLSTMLADLKKEIEDFKKTLKKLTPKAAQKKEIDPDQVWQLLLNADKKDYEKICLKYGIVDFRGMLRQLQEMKKEREDKQAQYVYSIANLKHVRVNQEQANASFDVEMELKNLESRIYLYKDGEMVNFRLNDDNVKHCLRQVGKKYNFIINDLQPEDAGVYQIKIEDVDIFSTELEAENIPVYFRYPLDEARCHEQGNAVFQCTLYEPCFNAVWFHKKNQLKPNDKYEISVSNDGLTHHLVIKNAQPSDKGTYTIDIGRRTSSAWLDKLRQDHLDDSSMGKDGQYKKGQDGSAELFSPLGKEGYVGKDGKMRQFSAIGTNMAGDSNHQVGLYGADSISAGTGTDEFSGVGGAAGLNRKEGMLGSFGDPSAPVGLGGLYGREGMPGGTGLGWFDSTGDIGGLYDKNGMPSEAGVGGAGGIGGLYDKDGKPIGVGVGGARGMGGLYDKDGRPIGTGLDGLYDKDGKPIGAGLSGDVGTGGLYDQYGRPIGTGGNGFYDKDGKPIAAGIGGLYDRDGRPVGGFYDKDGRPIGTGLDGLFDKDGKPIGAGGSVLYDKDGRPIGAGLGGLFDKDGKPIGAGIGGFYDKDGRLIGAGGLYDKDGKPIGSGIGGFYDKDGRPIGTGLGGLFDKDGKPIGAGLGDLYDKDGKLIVSGIGGFYDKDGKPIGAGIGGFYDKDGRAIGAGGSALYDRDGKPIGAGFGGFYDKDGKPIGAGIGEFYDKDGRPIGAGGSGLYDRDGKPIGAGFGGLYDKDGKPIRAGIGGFFDKDGKPIGAGVGGLGGAGSIGGLYDKDGRPIGASGFGFYDKDGKPIGAGIGGLYDKDGRPIGAGLGGLYDKDGRLIEAGSSGLYDKDGRPIGAGIGGLYDKDGMPIGAGGIGLYDKDGSPIGADGSGLYDKDGNPIGAGIGGFYDKDGSPIAVGGSGLYDKDGNPIGTGIGGFYDKDGSPIGAGLGGLYDKDGRPVGAGLGGLYDKDGKPIGTGIGGLYDKDGKLIVSGTGGFYDKDGRPIGAGGSGLYDKDGKPIGVGVGGLYDKDGRPIGVGLAGLFDKDGKPIGAGGSVLYDKDGSIPFFLCADPPNVNSELLEKLKKEPIVVKAGKNAIVKIPFEGQKPIRSSWLKDEGELLDDARINTEYSDNYTRLCISSANRKDCGDYKVKLRNESGSTEATFKLIVIDKPQPPTGPIEVVESSTSGITIQWKPPRDDGGKPIQSYVIERQQVGRKTWVTLGETTGNSTIFTTNKVEQDKRYYFRVRAVNAEGTSEVLESDEVMAASKVFPGPPAPPKIISANRGAITLSWAAPHKTGNSRILGYTVEKSKKGSNTWIPVTDLPITEKKYTVTDLKEGLQYEFRVAAINSAGTGEASAPSEAVFARDPMQPPGPVKDLKVVNTDYCSISLSWTKPGTEEESPVKGYIVEMRHTDMLKWTQCNALPIPMTAYIVRGLKPREMYFLRVRAVNDGGFGEPVELDSYVQTIPPIVQPKVLVKDTVKSFMIVKAGDTIRVRIPFEASPPPEVHWLKDGHVLTAKATTATREGVSQLIIPAADFSDSGHYSIVLQSEHGKKETFSFLVQVLDVPEAPGPIQLVERVPDTVTLMWEPSPTEKRDRNLNYMVMRRDSSKGSWNMVADLIYTNKCTVANFVPGRDYFFRVLAKNYMGVSEPSETVQPWSIHKERDYSQNETLKWRLDPGKKGGPKMLYSLTNHCKENCSQLLRENKQTTNK